MTGKERERPASGKEGRELPERGELFYLWHPGSEALFSGYGLTTEAGRKDRLVGLLLVDRPRPADPAWLEGVAATFGGYELVPMTAAGERGIVCEMVIAQESAPFVRQFAGQKSADIQRALLPLLDHPPAPCFRLTWNEEVHAWQSQFHLELSAEMRAVFAEQGPGCFAVQRGEVIAFVTQASEADIVSFQGKPVLYRWELYRLPTAPVLRLHVAILDRPDAPFLLETFLNVGDEEQRGYVERLALQPALSFDFFGEDFSYRYTKQLEHPFPMRRDLAELARLAQAYWDALPVSERDFDRAKAEFQRRFPL